MESTKTSVSTQTEQTENQAPSLHGDVRAATPSPSAEEDEWEMISPEGAFTSGMVLVTKNMADPIRLQRRSSSVPDFRFMASLEADLDDDCTKNGCDGKLPTSVVWGNPVSSVEKVSSFIHVLSSRERDVGATASDPNQDVLTPLKLRNKIKPKFVVAPIRRCTKSTGDLQSLVQMNGEVMGEQDAIEYYAQKSAGQKGRQNGLKIRPDEAKRRDIILNKKGMQRQAQSSR